MPPTGELLIYALVCGGGVVLGLLLRSLAAGRVRDALARAERAGQEQRERIASLEASEQALRQRLQEQALSLRGLETERAAQHQRIEELTAEREALQTKNSTLGAEQAAAREREAGQQRQLADQQKLLEESKQQLKQEFENLAHRIFEERGKQLGSTQQAQLESLLKPFGEQIKSFQSRVNEVHKESVHGQASVTTQLRSLMEVGLKMNDQAENLTRALKGDKKTTGNWGEVQLERTLQMAGLERGVHYEAQSAMQSAAGKRQLPDFLIKLPDGKHLVIDSKVSLVDYDRAVSAESEEAREEALKAHAQSLRRHIDALADKDYAALPGMHSPSLVFMFMPIEAAYIEALKYNRELFNDGYRKNVVMVSHTTLLPMLRTVANLWIAYQSNEEARAISDMAGDIHNKVVLLGRRLEDMGKSLATVSKRYNDTVTALVGQQGLNGKVERFKSLAANARDDLPRPPTLHGEPEHERLAVLQGEEPRLSAIDSKKKPS
jgi:DNA recombination protein RmuC